jgi:hypothetical protein
LQGTTDRLTGNVDLLICNPPYVETPNCEEGNDDIRLGFFPAECLSFGFCGQIKKVPISQMSFYKVKMCVVDLGFVISW